MGRRNRERIERIKAGTEKPLADKILLDNPLSRKVISFQSREAVVNELTKGSTEQVVSNLDELSKTGTVPDSKIRKSLMSKAPGEMDKAIRKLQREDKEITVDSLCAEAESTPSFVQMCSNIGLPMSWFRELAKKRMEAHGL